MKPFITLLALVALTFGSCTVGDETYLQEVPKVSGAEYQDTHILPPVMFSITSYDKVADRTDIWLIDDDAEIRKGWVYGKQTVETEYVSRGKLNRMKAAVEPIEKQVDIEEMITHFRTMINAEKKEWKETAEDVRKDIGLYAYYYTEDFQALNCNPNLDLARSYQYSAILLKQQEGEDVIYNSHFAEDLIAWMEMYQSNAG